MFGEWAASYDSTIKDEFEKSAGIGYQEFMEQLLSVFDIPEGGYMLDVATGTALAAIATVRKMAKCCRVIGIDMSSEMLRQARLNVERAGMGDVIVLKECSAEELPFDEHSFDLVTCSLAIHHMNVPKVLAEISRVLKSGGQLVIGDYLAPPTWQTPMGRIGVTLFRFIKRFSSDSKERADIGYAAIYSRRKWGKLLARNKLEISKWEQYPKPGVQQWAPFPFIVVARKGS